MAILSNILTTFEPLFAGVQGAFCSLSPAQPLTIPTGISVIISRVCGKKFVGGVRSQESVAGRQEFQALLPSLFVPVYVLQEG